MGEREREAEGGRGGGVLGRDEGGQAPTSTPRGRAPTPTRPGANADRDGRQRRRGRAPTPTGAQSPPMQGRPPLKTVVVAAAADEQALTTFDGTPLRRCPRRPRPRPRCCSNLLLLYTRNACL